MGNGTQLAKGSDGHINVRLGDERLNRVELACTVHGVTVSGFVRKAVDAALTELGFVYYRP